MSPEKFDILFVISIQTHGNGGHFHSLNHISKFLSKYYKIGIITIGRGESKVLERNPLFLQHLSLKGYNILGFKIKLNQLIDQLKPTYTNCFDWPSLAIMGFTLKNKSTILCHTKCGGPNSAYNFVQNLVLFSKENHLWFKERKIFDNSNIAVIPNRVKTIQVDENAFLEKKSELTFLSISRIGAAYTPNLKKAINLIKQLNQKVELVIIGTIEDRSCWQELKDMVALNNLPVRILTDIKYTNEASRYLRFADVFIGSGRGVMEACSLNIPVLTNAKNMDIPVVLDESSFETLSTYNFSPRAYILNNEKGIELEKIQKLVTSESYYKGLSDYCKNAFDKNFSLETSYKGYKKFYENASSWSYSIIDNRRDILRALYRFWRPV